MELLDKEVFSDIATGHSREVDVVVKVRFRDGANAFFIIHLESQSAPVKNFAWNMFKYFARLDEKYGLPIYPIAVFTFDKPLRPEPNRYRVDFPGFRVLSFAFRPIQLNRLNWRDYVRNPNPVASALMTKTRIAPGDRPHVKLECLRMLATLKLDKAKSRLIGAFVTNYLKLTSSETKVYDKMLESVKPKEQKVVMELPNEWIDKGVEIGPQQGRQEGTRDLIVRQLRRRLGSVPVKLARQVEQLDDAAMFALGDALLDFAGLADAQRWLAKHGK